MPREPVRQTESFYEESLGNAKLVMHMSAGDNAVFLVGHSAMPYAIRDDKVLRQTYQASAKEFTADPSDTFHEPKDFYLNGKLGLEMTTVTKDPRFVPKKMRLIIIGRDMYVLIVSPINTEEETTPPTKAAKAKLLTETERFFSSIKIENRTPVSTVTESPIFASSFSNQIFRNEYFKFSISVPENWTRVSAEDVDSVRKWGREVLSANSTVPIPDPNKKRRNLASFVSAPLGTERIAMLAINLGIPATKPDAPMQMAKMTEQLLSKLQNYEIIKASTRTSIGDIPAISLETKIKLLDGTQNQVVWFVQQNGYVIAFTLTYYEVADRQKAFASIETLKFEKL
ncbi:MAG TPA: hypothetical protein VJ781_00900 [Pyrinomonadaceae bacterium]|nr:hypothetical protein [Pyrinomonadaceae bacterium]